MSFQNLKVERIEDQLMITLSKLYPIHKPDALVKIGEKKWSMSDNYIENGDKIYNFEIRPDDTWVVTYPRSGTTLMQELVWLVANDMNFDEAQRRTLSDRFPFIDMEILSDSQEMLTIMSNKEKKNIDKYTVKFVQNQLSPRFIKSHLPLELLPTVINSDCKIIYVARNPKDVVVSYYNFQKDYKLYQYQGTFEQFCNNFMDNHVHYSPYWEHIKEAWAMRHKANLLFLFYEDLIKDLPAIIKTIAVFFDKAYSNEQIVKLMEHLKIENFRKNPMVNQPSPRSVMEPKQFVRKGKVNAWKETFTPEIEEKFNKWIADNLKDTDLRFPN
ncbi:Sulfotransferase 4A1 [Trachymyrmex septentrionalis]|uniref:Sulfotransferase 4A1 n=1 Tax=Trachymyrmex septentrionalis TaxID=34720 RepID=A0A195FN60_9HYME|nr:PREDICTED: sulfotransferase 4A1-like isoform X1 [Trachymyrmex septentrionalis]XP_018339264.1 PREDICTED: sulfotransferase 4A1-like isoform X2 [Trachymyrmex septentrionalis]KYN41324.1 Sulfotransferase 4A1 [Trachymyrmex septentrionalis]